MDDSIKLFSFNRKYYHVYGIYPLQPNRIDQSLNLRNWIFVIGFAVHSLPSAAFFFCEAKSMLEYGISFMAASTGLFVMCIFLTTIWRMKSTWSFIENCEQFIEKRHNSITIYRETIGKIEILCEYFGIASVITIIFQTLPSLFYALICYYIFDSGRESFVLFFPVKWPFDWKTPMGFFVVWLVQSAGMTAICLFVMMYLSLIFGSCWLFIVMAEDITKELAKFNNDIKVKASREECVKWDSIVQLHSDAKRCVDKFNAIAKYSLFIFMFFFVVSVSTTLVTLQFQLMDDDANPFETFILATIVFWIFGSLFIICELGEQMTTEFVRFEDELERCDWHTLSIKMQRMYLIFLSDTQQSRNIKCYGNIKCTRGTFKKIIKTGFSYFMTLRSFEI